MLFKESTSIAVAFAASSFLTGVAASHNNLFESYADLASSEPSANFCSSKSLMQVGDISKLCHNKRHLDADVAAAVVSNVLSITEKDVGSEISKREDASSDEIAQSLYELVQKREEAPDAEAVSEVISSILSLVEKDTGSESNSIGKRKISAGVAAEVAAKFLGLIGVKAGAAAGVKIGKREVDSDAAARVSASFLALSKKENLISKRNISASAAAGFAANILGIFGVSAGACANLFVGWGFPTSSCGQSSGGSCNTCNKKGGKRDAILDSAAVLADLTTRGIDNPDLVKKYLIELYGESEESATELTKRGGGGISVDVAAQFAAHILGLLGVKVGAAAGVKIGKRDEIASEDVSEVIANILELTAREVDVDKRKISADVGAQLAAQILGLIGVKAGAAAGVKIGKREIEAELAAKVAAQLLDKRNISASAAAGVAANILGIFGVSASACASVFVGWGFPTGSCGGSSGGSSGGKDKGGKGKNGETYKRDVDESADAVALVLSLAQRDSLAMVDSELVKKHLIANGNDEATADELIKRGGGGISVDVAAQVAAHILGLLGVKVGAAAGVKIGKREIDTDVAADVLASLVGLVSREQEAPANVKAGKRSLELSAREAVDSEVASEVFSNMFSFVERSLGSEEVSKREIVDKDVAAKIAATIVSLAKADEGSEDVDVEKRNISASAAAGVAANILGIFGISASACANLFVGWGFPTSSCSQGSSNCKTCLGHKRELTPEVGAAVIAQILDLVEKDLSSEVGSENIKRELKELYGHSEEEAEELSKRKLSAEVAAAVSAKILGLLGIKADAGASVHVGKRDVFATIGHGLLNEFKTVVPQASFSVSDAAWVKDDIFKVTVNFESVESAKLFDNFHEELKTMAVEGTGVYDGEEILWDGSSKSKVDNFARWSSTILVRAPEKNGYHCMPEDFSIKFDWNKRPDSVLHSVWKDHFSAEYQYTLSQDFHTGAHKDQATFDVHQQTSQSSGEFDIASLRYWESSSTELANFCWPSQCKSN